MNEPDAEAMDVDMDADAETGMELADALLKQENKDSSSSLLTMTDDGDYANPYSKQTITEQVARGDTLSHVFKRAGVSMTTMYQLIGSSREIKRELTALRPGQRFDFVLDENDELLSLTYERSITESYHFEREETASRFNMEKQRRELDVKEVFAAGTIQSSLFLSGTAAGIPERIIMELANIFAWDIDFALDIRQGDAFKIIYEELYLDGKKVRDGAILAAEFTNRGNTFTGIRYVDTQGNASYYTPSGDSMRKAFLRSPVEFARISSHFNLNRRHPVLHTIRAHKGTDYAAPTGTPIRAAGDGRVHFVGAKGGYGNVVILQHGEQYRTLYAHLHRFRRGLRQGERVRQGDLIGYVGSTGLATGPHLHYEFYENGQVRNPVTVKLPNAEPIKASEKQRFTLHATALTNQLASIEIKKTNQVARAD